MTNLSVIENKISQAKKYLIILSGYKKYGRVEIETDVNLRGAVERYLYLAIQSAIDLAEAIISYRRLRKPETLSESFEILVEAGILNADLSGRLVKMAGFRNLIAHDYERLDYDIVFDILQNRQIDIEDFLRIVEGLS